MAASKILRLVLVTPEKTLLDQPVRELRFPLYDGQMGVLPGRAPLVGRLGAGELAITFEDGSHHSYFVDGGFVQIKGDTTTVLTNRAVPVEALNRQQAEEQLKQASSRPAHGDLELATRDRDVQRARAMVSLSRKSHAGA